MPTAKRTYRVFVSSTFTDMQIERRALQESVFPRLEALCQQQGCSFQAVDLRWGVGEEAQYDHKTMDICLNEIARCQRLSPKPNFIILLGDKYGWRPLPNKIPGAEMSRILETATLEEQALLKRWYKEDRNAVPDEYLLQPRDEEHRDDKVWRVVEKELKTILRAAVDRLEFTEKQREKYFASATHQEITRGALKPPSGVLAAEEHVFAYLRTIKHLPETSAAKDYLDWGEDGRDQDAKAQLELLRAEIEEKLSAEHRHPYSGEWVSGSLQLDAEAEGDFAERVYQDLSGIITRQLVELEEDDPLQRERKSQEEFRRQRIEHFTGREAALAEIGDYLTSDSRQILAVSGPSGSGKTSVLAQAAQTAPQEGVTVCRFLGTTAGSSDLYRLLDQLVRHIAGEYGAAGAALLQSGENEKKLATIAGVKELFGQCLFLARANRPLVIFLDALNQLSGNEQALSFDWLPSYLPPHVRLVVSALPEVADKIDQATIFHLQPMPTAEGEVLLDRWLLAAGRVLQQIQRQAVMASFEPSGNPLYLRLAFEKVKTWHSYTAEIRLPDDIDGMLRAYFTGLEKEHGKYLVEKACGYLLCGRYQGLAETELLDILVRDEVCWNSFLAGARPEHREEIQAIHRLPSIVWSRLFLDMEPYLAEKDGGGAVVISFYHRQFRDYIGKAHLKEAAAYHLAIADYFDQQTLNTRKVAELPWQLVLAGEWEKLYRHLTDLSFVSAALSANEYDVKSYWALLEKQRFSLKQVSEAVISQFDDLPDKNLVWKISLLLGHTGYLREAFEIRKLLIESDRKQNNYDRLQMALGGQANILYDWGKFEEAMGLLIEQENLCRKIGNKLGLANSLGDQALILSDWGEDDYAFDYLKEQECLYWELGDKMGLQRSFGNQGVILYKLGKFDEDLELQKKKEQICRELGEENGLLVSLNNQAVIFGDRENYEEAMAIMREVESHSRRIKNPFLLAGTLLNQAIVLGEKMKNTEEAKSFLKEACKIARKHRMANMIKQIKIVYKKIIENI